MTVTNACSTGAEASASGALYSAAARAFRMASPPTCTAHVHHSSLSGLGFRGIGRSSGSATCSRQHIMAGDKQRQTCSMGCACCALVASCHMLHEALCFYEQQCWFQGVLVGNHGSPAAWAAHALHWWRRATCSPRPVPSPPPPWCVPRGVPSPHPRHAACPMPCQTCIKKDSNCLFMPTHVAIALPCSRDTHLRHVSADD